MIVRPAMKLVEVSAVGTPAPASPSIVADAILHSAMAFAMG